MAAPQNSRLTCTECEFYSLRHADEAALARAEAAGHPLPRGQCKRFPAAVLKEPDDCCGEHSELIAERARFAAAVHREGR